MSQHLFKRNGRFTPLRSSIFKAKAGMFYCVHANHTSNYAQEEYQIMHRNNAQCNNKEYITFLHTSFIC